MARYMHVFDLCFEISTDLDEDEIFNKENLPAFLKAARQRLKTIEFLGDSTEAFGLVETYEDDIPEDCEQEQAGEINLLLNIMFDGSSKV